jgi:mannosyltransferase OCH1-like enzyme
MPTFHHSPCRIKIFFLVSQNHGERADILRCEILYQFGGLYADIDFECLKPFDILHQAYTFYGALFPLENDALISNGIIDSIPGHPLIKYYLDILRQHWKNPALRSKILHRTGPFAFQEAFFQTLKNNPDEDIIALPPSYFFPIKHSMAAHMPSNNEPSLCHPETFAIHHWEGAWDKKEARVQCTEEKHMVIIITSYNTARWCERNLLSVFQQQYSNYTVILTDDCSFDDTFDLVTACVKKYKQEHRVHLMRNATRYHKLTNLTSMINQCDDHDIVVLLDGNDWLAHNKVFTSINNTYADPDIWITYGQFAEFDNKGHYGRGFNEDIPDWVIENDLLRSQFGAFSHLRTFYAKLFKKIRHEDLMYNGEYVKMALDTAIMLPMMEMARYHFKFIPDILYVYNTTNELCNHYISRQTQYMLDRIIRSRRPYPALYSLFS